MRRSRLGAVLAFGITACVATAAPGGFPGEKLQLNASDQAFAHTVTLRRSDFVPSAYGSVWRRVRAKPVVSALPQCPIDADMSKFVITGIAHTRWLGGNLELDSQAAVLDPGCCRASGTCAHMHSAVFDVRSPKSSPAMEAG